jgi:hypothetical protein
MKKLLPYLGTLAVGALIALGVVLIAGGGDDDKGGAAATNSAGKQAKSGTELAASSYTLRYPKGWQKLTKDDIAEAQGAAVSGVKRSDGAGILFVQQGGKLEGDLKTVGDQLTKSFQKRLKDFKHVKTATVKLPAGEALSYTFVRGSSSVQNLVVVPSGDKTYTLNSIVNGNAQDAAREVAGIIRTFDTEKN